MKAHLKGVIALALMGALASVGMTAYAQGSDDNISNKTELYMKRLSVLGIMSETEDMTKSLTRGEMAKIVCGVSGYDVIYSDEKIFTDVPRDYTYADYINTAYTYGIIDGKGDGIFAPDEEVTREQMYKMLLCAAGYQFFADQRGGYPGGYISLAGENDMTMPGAGGTVTIAEAAYTVFKALEMPVIRGDYDGSLSVGSGDDSLLNRLLDKNDMEMNDGVLTSDGYTYLSGADSPNSLYAEVDGVRISNESTSLGGLIGKKIEYFTKEDTMIAAYEYPGENNTIRFTADDIDSVNGISSYIVYTDINKKKSYNLSDSPFVVYNRQGVEGYTESQLIPDRGDVTLIDNNDDGDYDVVMISEKNYFVVDDASTSGLSVQYKKYPGQNESGYYITESELNDTVYYTVTDGDGNELDTSAVSKNAVIGVEKSLDGTMINVVVTKNMIEGELETLGSDTLKVNGILYEIDVDREGNGLTFDVSPGDNVSVYLNENDRVVFCETTSGGSGNYAYIKNVYRGDDPEIWCIKAVMCGNLGSLENRKYWWVKDKMAQNDGIETFELSGKVKINDAKQNDSNIYEINKQVVELAMNDEGEITAIDVLVPEFEYTEGKYNHNTSALVQPNLEDDAKLEYDNPAALLVGNIKTLVIPDSVNNEYSEDEYLAKYRIENGEANSNVAFYEIPEGSQTPHLLVLRTALTESGTAQGDASSGILVSNLRASADEDGEMYYITEMYSADGSIKEVIIREDAKVTDSSVKTELSQLEKGDVVELSWDSRDRANTVHVVASAASPVARMQMGVVEKVQKNVIWNKSDGENFYNLFFYIDDDTGERTEAGVRADYPVFSYEDGYVERIEMADVVADPDGIDGDTVIIAGKIAIILPIE